MSEETLSNKSQADLNLYESLQNKSLDLSHELEHHISSIQQRMKQVNNISL